MSISKLIKKNNWDDLSTKQKNIVKIITPLELLGKAAALITLWRLPKEKINGSKLKWAQQILFVSTLGTVMFFWKGIKR